MNNLISAREISDLKFLCKLINNKTLCDEIRSVINFYVPKRDGLRQRQLTFTIPIEFKNNRKTSSIFRILETFNSFNDKIDITSNSKMGFYKSLNILVAKFV